MAEETEWQPVRIAPAAIIAKAHGYWPPLEEWNEMQGKIIKVRRQPKGTAWWDYSGVPTPVSPCEGDEFAVKFEDQFVDGMGLKIQSVCEHQILAD